jgi:SAM-dependent methyltransferase
MKSFRSYIAENETGYQPSPTQAELNAMGVNAAATQIETVIHQHIEQYLTLDELKDGLEYGSGLGHGASYLGLDSFEPFPKSHIKPTYTNVTQIDQQYKFILNTYVLNVVAYDTRDIIIRNIGKLLKPGGRAVFIVRGFDDVSQIKTRIVEYGPAEFITKKGSDLTYQKGFTFDELVSLIKRNLGSGYTVLKFPTSAPRSIKVQVIKAD